MVIGLQMDPIFPKELLLEGPGKCVPADSFIILKGYKGTFVGAHLAVTRHAACS